MNTALVAMVVGRVFLDFAGSPVQFDIYFSKFDTDEEGAVKIGI